MERYVARIVGLAAMTLTIGCRRHTPAESQGPASARLAPTEHTPPNAGRADQIAYHIDRVRRAHGYESGALHEEAAPGNVLVVVDLTLENLAHDERFYALDEAEFVGSDTHRYRADRSK